MTQQGIVSAKDEHYVYVTVRQTTACEGCHKADGCEGCTSVLEVKAHNDCSAEVGDTVSIETATGRVLLYAFLIFVFPLFPAAAAYFAVRSVTGGQWLPILAAVGALALFYLFMRLTLDKRSEKRCDRRASEIINKAENHENTD